MKKIILLLLLIISIILTTPVFSVYKTYITTDTWKYQVNASSEDYLNLTTVGVNYILHSYKNFTDGNWDTYALVNGTFFMNYSKTPDYTQFSLWRVKYNTSRGIRTINHSIPSACWAYNNTKLELKINTTGNRTQPSNGTNAHYCRSALTTWRRIGPIYQSQAIYEEAMWWDVAGRTYNISYYIEHPAAYTVLTKTAINFSLYINDTHAKNANHTTFNVSVYTRLNSTADYTENVSNLLINNNSYRNVTLSKFSNGDRVWWFFSAKDNYSRVIFNTSARIFDIDLVYQTLSLGANKVINLSLDSGEITTTGGITGANLSLDNMTLTGGAITSPPINVTSDGDLSIAGNISLGEKITFALGEVIDNLVDGLITITGGAKVSGALYAVDINASLINATNVNATTINVQNITLANITTADFTCNTDQNGVMIYNATDHKAYICNSTDWNALWS